MDPDTSLSERLHYVAEGRALGKAEGIIDGRAAGERMGRCALLLRQLTRRFGDVPLAAWARVHAAEIEELDAIGDRLLTAETLDEALGPRPPLRLGLRLRGAGDERAASDVDE